MHRRTAFAAKGHGAELPNLHLARRRRRRLLLPAPTCRQIGTCCRKQHMRCVREAAARAATRRPPYRAASATRIPGLTPHPLLLCAALPLVAAVRGRQTPGPDNMDYVS